MAITALYNISTVLVTNDSGPAHFSAITAAAVDCAVRAGDAKALWEPGQYGVDYG